MSDRATKSDYPTTICVAENTLRKIECGSERLKIKEIMKIVALRYFVEINFSLTSPVTTFSNNKKNSICLHTACIIGLIKC